MKKYPILTIFIVIIFVIFVDISNLDSLLHKLSCNGFGLVFNTRCPDFYDLPIWDVAVALGTLTAVYYAYFAIRESNKRFEIEQTPYVVLDDRIYTAAGSGTEESVRHERLHTINITNVGRGSAINLTVTSDPEGKISIIEGSNPHSISLPSSKPYVNWAIDEQQVIKGLRKQGITNINLMVKDIPTEESLNHSNKHKADFHLYIWYKDQLENKYMTRVKIRHTHSHTSAPHFFKVMENKKVQIKKI